MFIQQQATVAAHSNLISTESSELGVLVRVWGWTDETMAAKDHLLIKVIDLTAELILQGVPDDSVADRLVEVFPADFCDADVSRGAHPGEIEVLLQPC